MAKTLMEPNFFELTADERDLGDIGRKMMDAAATVTDDKLFNKMSELGNRLTSVGVLFGARVNEFSQEEQDFVMDFQAGKIK
tara:strand:+ start:72 stop:317 length:246 start_codon:yes stop_codon:yes gene_type:complete